MTTDVVARPSALVVPDDARRHRSPVVAGFALFAIYVLVSLLLAPHAHLGDDTATKVATMRVMEEESTLVPDIGYWAEAEDPTGALHPLYLTRALDDHWLVISTLPMLLPGSILYRVGGYHLALLLPMLGGVGCALAARGLARRLGAGNPDLAFWIVGLASPVALYAIDFWEHAPGLALMLFGVCCALDAMGSRTVRPALFAGALFGGAATMRTEALVYGMIAGALVVGAALLPRFDPFLAVKRAGAMLGGVAALLLANDLLERAVLGTSMRAGRASGAAADSGNNFDFRVLEAVRTALDAGYGNRNVGNTVGLTILVLIGAATIGVLRRWPTPMCVTLLVIATIPVLLRLSDGTGWVRGLIPAFPLAAAGVAAAWLPKMWRVGVIALGALPIVYATQYSGGAYAQWGGRYTLTSALLLGVIGIVVLAERALWLLWSIVAMCAATTALGVFMLIEKTHEAGPQFEAIAAISEDVVITREPFLLREAAGTYTSEHRWLAAEGSEELVSAFDVAAAHGADRVAVLDYGWGEFPEVEVDGWRVVERTAHPLMSGAYYVTVMEPAPAEPTR